MGILGEVLTLTSSPGQVMAYSSHSAQSNGFLQPAGKGAAPTAHRGVSAPEGCIPSQRPWNSLILLKEVSPRWGKEGGEAAAWAGLSCWCFGQSNDLQLVRDALRSLRNSFSGHDPQHHTIDSLEQGIASLMERLHRVETHKRQDRRVKDPPGTAPAPHTSPRGLCLGGDTLSLLFCAPGPGEITSKQSNQRVQGLVAPQIQ